MLVQFKIIVTNVSQCQQMAYFLVNIKKLFDYNLHPPWRQGINLTRPRISKVFCFLSGQWVSSNGTELRSNRANHVGIPAEAPLNLMRAAQTRDGPWEFNSNFSMRKGHCVDGFGRRPFRSRRSLSRTCCTAPQVFAVKFLVIFSDSRGPLDKVSFTAYTRSLYG